MSSIDKIGWKDTNVTATGRNGTFTIMGIAGYLIRGQVTLKGIGKSGSELNGGFDGIPADKFLALIASLFMGDVIHVGPYRIIIVDDRTFV